MNTCVTAQLSSSIKSSILTNQIISFASWMRLKLHQKLLLGYTIRFRGPKFRNGQYMCYCILLSISDRAIVCCTSKVVLFSARSIHLSQVTHELAYFY
eukprot:5868791-Amphidinium_carterae.1